MKAQNGSRKIGRHSRIVVKDTILKDETGAPVSHMTLFAALVKAGAQGIHNAPGAPRKR